MLKDLTKKQEIPSFSKWVKKLTDKLFNNNGNNERCSLSCQQMSALKSLQENKYNIIKGYRRAGLSTMLRLNTLYNILYKSDDNYHVLYILNNNEAFTNEKNMFLKLLNDCDEYVVMTKNERNKVELLFENKHIVIEFISQYGLNGRRDLKEELNEINIDNAAFIEDKDTSDSIAVMARQTKANVSIASVPNREKGLFYETWRDSLAGTAPFKTISLKWYLDDRFNRNLKGNSGLQTYDIDNIGMKFEALENHDMITNDWYEQKKVLLGSDMAREIDGEFV